MEEVLFALWAVAILGPLIWAWKEKASISMALTLSLLLGYIVQLIWNWTGYYYLVSHLWMVPNDVLNSGEFYTLITSGFIHDPFSPLHVLGNIIIIALVGIPLEERLGRGRWLLIYFTGLLGGSIAWTIANSDSFNPALGASGAAFGILGAYLAGWPNDEVLFPFILIRKWPVSWIALIYFGLEVINAWKVYGFSELSSVAHMAHLGGFLATYLALPLVRKGTTWEGEIEMKELPFDHPFDGFDDIVARLREEGDEKETRQAWMEELALKSSCPICGGELGVNRLQIICETNKSHLSWP